MNKKNCYRWSRLLLLLLVLMVIFCLAGCGQTKVELNTSINLDLQESGSREMTLSLNADDFSSSLGFSVEDLEAVLKEVCPKELSWESKIEDGEYYCTFLLKFKNLKNYEAKVKKIIGRKAHVDLVSSVRIFSSGISYKEDFHSQEFFGWLISALREKKYLPEEEIELFQIGNTEIHYKDQVFTVAGDQAVYDTFVKKSAKRIDIRSTYHANNLCDRDVSIFFDEDTMTAMGQVIKSRLENRCPEGASISWDGLDGDSFCTFHQENMTAQELDDYMKCIFMDSESFVHEEGIRRPGTFEALCDWNETLDVSLMTSGEQKNFTLGYFVQWDKGVKLGIYNQNEGKELKLKDSERYPGYKTVLEENALSRSIKTEFQFEYRVKKIQVKDRFTRDNKLDRSIHFSFDSKLKEEDQAAILETVKDTVKDQGQVALEETEAGKCQLTIHSKLGLRASNQLFESVFGVEGQTSHELDKKLLEIKHPGKLKICLDFTKFIANDPADTLLEYDCQLNWLESIDPGKVKLKDPPKKSKQTLEKHKIQVSQKGAYLDLSIETETVNRDGIYLGLIVLCIVLLLIVFRLMPPIFSKLWTQMKKGPKKLNQAFEGYSEEEQELLNHRYESEQRRSDRDKALRQKWKEVEETQAPTSAAGEEDQTEYQLVQENEISIPDE